MTRMEAAAKAAVLVVLAAIGAGGCVEIDDPEHCAHREGDATCAELYPGSIEVQCSLCDRFYNGCVNVDPEHPLPEECRVDDGESSESTDGDDSSSGDAAAACEACPDDDVGPEGGVR